MKENNFIYEFYEWLKHFLELNRRDVAELHLKKNKSTINIMLKNDILFQFRKAHEVYLKNNSKTLLDKFKISYSKSTTKTDTIPLKILISDFVFINDNAQFLLELFDDIYLKNNPNSFSFCSKWKQCCDSLHCVETDATQASLCRSRKNILNGLIFNGKNSVLDENGKISEEKVRENVSKTPTFQITKLNLPTTSEQITLL